MQENYSIKISNGIVGVQTVIRKVMGTGLDGLLGPDLGVFLAAMERIGGTEGGILKQLVIQFGFRE
jgi:hypothetical protein